MVDGDALPARPGLLDLMPPLQQYAPPAKVIDKPVYSAFANRLLHDELRQRRVNTLVVTGAETNVCVLATVLAAVFGYRVIVVKDGLCSSVDQGHDALLNLYSRHFDIQVELALADELLEAWRS